MRRQLLDYLSAQGVQVRYFDYSVRSESLPAIRRRLREELRQTAEAGAYAVVGYSFGGVLARLILCERDPPLPPPRHLVLLASPVKAMGLCQTLGRWALYRWLTGECGQLAASPAAMAAVGLPAVATTCIYGTWRWWGPLALLGRRGAHDGMVTVEEAAPQAFETALAVRVSHALIPARREVQVQLARCAMAGMAGQGVLDDSPSQ